jgi:chaperonin GroES
MEPRLIKGIQAEYVPAKWSGQNTSGVRVVGKTVLVLMDKCSPKTTGGVDLPDDLIERMSMAAESGVLVACADGAFLLNEDMTAWSGAKPAPGDRVYVEKYAGKVVRGRDGEMYRIMDYGSIGATYEPEEKTPDGEYHPRDIISLTGGTGLGATATVTVEDGVVTGVISGAKVG